MYRVIIWAVGFIFAFVGLSLSLLSMLFTLLLPVLLVNPTTPTPQKRQTRSLHVSVQQNTRTSSTSLSLPPASTAKTGGMRNATRSLESVRSPLVTHYSIELPSLSPSASSSEKETAPPSRLKRKPTITFVHQGPFPTPPSVSSERVFVPIASQSGRCGLKVSTIWADRTPKLYRCVSSPHLTMPPTPGLNVLHKIEQQPKRKAKLCRKESGDRLEPRSASLDDRAVGAKKSFGKKKASFLRTNPYAAPYFISPPVPPTSSAAEWNAPR